MELWIRSQGGRRLTKVDNLTVTNIGEIVSGDDVNVLGDDNRKLGEYISYARAEEVLDEIHKILIDYKTMDRVVYSMPKE